jgi:L-lactate dehydrogenase complex protein LldE
VKLNCQWARGWLEPTLRASKLAITWAMEYTVEPLPCDFFLDSVSPMQVGLFIPCYIDQLYPQVGMATVDILERYGVDVVVPVDQTCCGQPMANTGLTEQARPLANRFLDIFADYEYVVCPSGSCTAMVTHHYDEYLEGRPGFTELKKKTFELTEFLVDVLKVNRIEGHFPHRVGLHQSCHGLRELRLGSSSELVGLTFNKARFLLESLEGIQLSELTRPDECCGFGGTFAIAEEAVSCMMGLDRIKDHEQAGTEILTANDMSCLMHLDGLIRRQKKPIRVMHIVEILNEATAAMV